MSPGRLKARGRMAQLVGVLLGPRFRVHVDVEAKHGVFVFGLPFNT